MPDPVARRLYQLVVEVLQALVQQGIPARRHVEGPKLAAEAGLLLLAAQPVGIEVEQRRIRIDPMTNETCLMVTDHAWPKDVDEAKALWNSQLHTLQRVLGA